MDQRLALQLDCNPTARLKWGVLASDGHFVAGPEGFGVHRAGAGHGPGLDARTAAAGLDRAPRSFTPERRLWARFRSCQPWHDQEL